MKPFGMLLLAVALAVAAWWWFTSEMPRRERERAAAAEAAARAGERADALYRWRDADGTLHVAQDPPAGVKYERISRTPQDGIEVDGSRE